MWSWCQVIVVIWSRVQVWQRRGKTIFGRIFFLKSWSFPVDMHLYHIMLRFLGWLWHIWWSVLTFRRGVLDAHGERWLAVLAEISNVTVLVCWRTAEHQTCNMNGWITRSDLTMDLLWNRGWISPCLCAGMLALELADRVLLTERQERGKAGIKPVLIVHGQLDGLCVSRWVSWLSFWIN